jgi:hypothetical protein
MKISANTLHRVRELAWDTEGLGCIQCDAILTPTEGKHLYALTIHDMHGDISPSLEDLKKLLRKHQEASRSISRIIEMAKANIISIYEAMETE